MENGLFYSCTLQELRFLSSHKDLLGVLAEAKPHLARMFGARRVHLEVARNGPAELIAVIKVNRSHKTDLALNREWLSHIDKQGAA